MPSQNLYGDGKINRRPRAAAVHEERVTRALADRIEAHDRGDLPADSGKTNSNRRGGQTNTLPGQVRFEELKSEVPKTATNNDLRMSPADASDRNGTADGDPGLWGHQLRARTAVGTMHLATRHKTPTQPMIPR